MKTIHTVAISVCQDAWVQKKERRLQASLSLSPPLVSSGEMHGNGAPVPDGEVIFSTGADASQGGESRRVHAASLSFSTLNFFDERFEDAFEAL